eukprot:UN31812
MSSDDLEKISEKAEAIKVNGNKCMKENKLQDALKLYSEAVKTDPVGKKAHIYFANRAACYMKMKDYENAILDAKESISLNGDYVKSHYRLANAYKMNDQTEEAVQSYENVLKMVEKTDKLHKICQDNIDNLKGQAPAQTGGMPDLGAMGGLGSLLGGLGGQGGLGGLSELLKNPQMQQMAANMMKDPNMMAKMNDMMKDPEALSKMGNLLGKDPSKIAEMGKAMQENPDLMATMQDKEKREELMVKVEKIQKQRNFVKIQRSTNY